MAVFRLLLVILDVLFIILCMIECSGDLEASYSAVPQRTHWKDMAASMFIELWNNRRQSMIRFRVGTFSVL